MSATSSWWYTSSRNSPVRGFPWYEEETPLRVGGPTSRRLLWRAISDSILYDAPAQLVVFRQSRDAFFGGPALVDKFCRDARSPDCRAAITYIRIYDDDILPTQRGGKYGRKPHGQFGLMVTLDSVQVPLNNSRNSQLPLLAKGYVLAEILYHNVFPEGIKIFAEQRISLTVNLSHVILNGIPNDLQRNTL